MQADNQAQVSSRSKSPLAKTSISSNCCTPATMGTSIEGHGMAHGECAHWNTDLCSKCVLEWNLAIMVRIVPTHLMSSSTMPLRPHHPERNAIRHQCGIQKIDLTGASNGSSSPGAVRVDVTIVKWSIFVTGFKNPDNTTGHFFGLQPLGRSLG